MPEDWDPTWIEIDWDPRKERMRGVAVHGNTPFDVPYISHVAGNLWQGGCSNGLNLPHEIVHVVSLYPWEQYVLHDGVRTHEQIKAYDAEGEDSLGGLSEDQVMGIAAKVVECCEDGPTLVHCQAGLNRSGLIAGVGLLLLGEARTGAEAVKTLRERRSPAVLCNQRFANWLEERFRG